MASEIIHKKKPPSGGGYLRFWLSMKIHDPHIEIIGDKPAYNVGNRLHFLSFFKNEPATMKYAMIYAWRSGILPENPLRS
jgi:hypothetical protein